MFSVMSVCYSVHRGGPMCPLSLIHWVSLYIRLGTPCPLKIHHTWDTPSPTPPPDIRLRYPRPDPSLVTSGGDHWRPFQTCPFGDPYQSGIWWWSLKLKHIRFPSGGTHLTGMLSCWTYKFGLFCKSSMAYSDRTHMGTGQGPGPGPEWVTVYYVKLSHCNLCGNLNGSYTLALYQSWSRSRLRSHISSIWISHQYLLRF